MNDENNINASANMSSIPLPTPPEALVPIPPQPPSAPFGITLSSEQSTAVTKIVEWFQNDLGPAEQRKN